MLSYKVLKELVHNFVEDEHPDNEFVKHVLFNSTILFDISEPESILENLLDIIRFGISKTAFSEKFTIDLFAKFHKDIIDYFINYLQRVNYHDLYSEENLFVPLYELIIPTIFDDLAFCLSWYIVEKLEKDYPELQEIIDLDECLSFLINVLRIQ